MLWEANGINRTVVGDRSLNAIVATYTAFRIVFE